MYNRIVLVGFLGRDAELKFTQTGKAVVNFSMATTRKWRGNDGELKEETQWHKIILWGDRGEKVSPYLLKGKLVVVEGRSTQRSWEDRDGNKRYTTEVVGDQVTLLSQKGSSEPDNQQQIERPAEGVRPLEDEDDIPF